MLVQAWDEFATIRVNRKDSKGDILSLSLHSPFVLVPFSVPDWEGPRETLSKNLWEPRRVFSSDTQEERTGNNWYRADRGMHWILFPSLHWQSGFTLYFKTATLWVGVGEWSPFHCKQSAGVGSLDEAKQAPVYGTWWDTSQGSWGTGSHCCQGTLHHIWKLMPVK